MREMTGCFRLSLDRQGYTTELPLLDVKSVWHTGTVAWVA